MAETPAPATPAPPAPEVSPPPATVKFVGKYETQEAFEKGIREIAKSVEFPMPEEGPIIGPGGRFATASEAEAAYKAMSRILSRKPAEAAPPAAPAEPAKPKMPENPLRIDQPTIAADAGVETVLAAVGVTAEAIAGQWQESGQLDEATYAKFAAKGYPRALVDGYLQGEHAAAKSAQAQAQSMRQSVVQQLGGEQQEQTLRVFAGSNLRGKDATFDAMNDAVERDPRLYPALMQYVAGKHAEAVGASKSRPLVAGGNQRPDQGTTLQRGTPEYFATVRAAGRGDKAAMARLKDLVSVRR